MAVVRPSHVFVSPEFRQRLEEALGHLAKEITPPAVVAFDPLPTDASRVALSSALSHQKTNDPKIDVEPERVMLIVYTSGTTGTPKGAALSHRAELARAAIMSSELQLTASDSYVAWAPLFHMSSTDYMLLTHGRGGKVLLLAKFDAPAVAKFLTREKVGWLLLMPGILDSMTDAINAQNLPIKGVRYVGCMADLSPIGSIKHVSEALGGAGYFNTFGTTEIGTIPGAYGTLDLNREPISLSKRQTTFSQIRIVDEEGYDVPFGVEGELVVRSPTMFSGYWNNDVATREALRDGWYHTGDICVLNSDGTYDYKGRNKYLIKSGGENVYPAEIEQVLMRHPRIEEAAAIRVPDERWGEVPAVYVAVNNGPSISNEELAAYCRASLAKFKVPKYFISISYEEFPRNVTGKVDRLLLEARFSRDQRGAQRP
jgi:fatty-acyl-CoA synthase